MRHTGTPQRRSPHFPQLPVVPTAAFPSIASSPEPARICRHCLCRHDSHLSRPSDTDSKVTTSSLPPLGSPLGSAVVSSPPPPRFEGKSAIRRTFYDALYFFLHIQQPEARPDLNLKWTHSRKADPNCLPTCNTTTSISRLEPRVAIPMQRPLVFY